MRFVRPWPKGTFPSRSFMADRERVRMGAGRQVEAGDRAVYFRCLALMFQSGVQLTRSFEILASQSEHPELSRASSEIAQRLRGGSSLSRSFLQARTPLTPFIVKLIQLGESSGTLGQVLLRLADHEEKFAALQQKVRAQLTYPAVILLAGLICLLVLPPWLFSVLRPALGNAGLPWFSQLVLGFSRLLGNPFFWLLAGAAGYATRARWNGWLCQLPGLAPALETLAQARFMRSFALALEAGVPLQHGMQLAGASSGSAALEAACKRTIESVLAGNSLAGGMAQEEVFPGLMIQGVKAGEESGRLADMLIRLAHLYEVQVETCLERCLALLEPVLMLLMGLAAGAFILATGMPLLRLVQSL